MRACSTCRPPRTRKRSGEAGPGSRCPGGGDPSRHRDFATCGRPSANAKSSSPGRGVRIRRRTRSGPAQCRRSRHGGPAQPLDSAVPPEIPGRRLLVAPTRPPSRHRHRHCARNRGSSSPRLGRIRWHSRQRHRRRPRAVCRTRAGPADLGHKKTRPAEAGRV